MYVCSTNHVSVRPGGRRERLKTPFYRLEVYPVGYRLQWVPYYFWGEPNPQPDPTGIFTWIPGYLEIKERILLADGHTTGTNIRQEKPTDMGITGLHMKITQPL